MYVENEKVVFPKSLYFSVKRNDSENGIRRKIGKGLYVIMAYDIDYDGHIQREGLPAATTTLSVNGSILTG